MNAALLVTADDALRSRVARVLGKRSVFIEECPDDALRVLRGTEMDLVILDVGPPARGLAHFLARARQLSPSAVIVCLHPAEGLAPADSDILEAADFLLAKPFTAEHLARVLRQAEEKQRLVQEVFALRFQPSVGAGVVAEGENTPPETATPASAALLNELAKALSAGFDLPRVLERFLDAVGEMLKPSRAALLLADETGSSFQIRAQRGVVSHVVKSARLSADGGLPLWLQMHGRVIQAGDVQAYAQEPLVRESVRELAMLQAVMAVPLVAQGDLVGILTLGHRITGVPYHHDETEALFNLATHLATAIGNIRLHHQLQYQKVYREHVLSHMSSGMISIDRHQTVTIMNRRAEKILELSASEILNRDLRGLPSPLGDLLYESLTTGRVAHRMEIQLARPKLPLEVSTYPIAGDEPAPIGAVMVFEDLSVVKQRAEEKRQAELYQLLTRVVARMVDEIKNPLVSIRSFMELLEDRFEDPEFRQRFAPVVSQDVRRLVDIFENMSALVAEREFEFEAVDVGELIDDCVAGLRAQAGAEPAGNDHPVQFRDPVSGKRVDMSLQAGESGLAVKGDRNQLKTAMSYLVSYLIRKSPDETARLSISVERPKADAEIVHLLVASRGAELRADEFQHIFNPVKVVQESLVGLGPCVSQRIIEAHGGRLHARKGRHEVAFLVELPLLTPI